MGIGVLSQQDADDMPFQSRNLKVATGGRKCENIIPLSICFLFFSTSKIPKDLFLVRQHRVKTPALLSGDIMSNKANQSRFHAAIAVTRGGKYILCLLTNVSGETLGLWVFLSEQVSRLEYENHW